MHLEIVPFKIQQLTETRVCILGCCPLPAPVPVVGQTGLAVVARGPVFAQTDAAAARVLRVAGDADVGVTVTLAPTAHYEVSDGVVIGLQHLGVTKHLVTKCVQILKGYPENRYIEHYPTMF